MKKNTIYISGLIPVLFMLTACGSQSTRQTKSGGGDGGNSSAPTPTPYQGGNIYNLPAAPEQAITINGRTPSNAYTFKTSKTLRVKISPLSYSYLSSRQALKYNIGCMSADVTVNGAVRASMAIKIEGASTPTLDTSPCKNNPTSQILDFSNVMTGSGPVSVSISNVQTDNCRDNLSFFIYGQYFYGYQVSGCKMASVWQYNQTDYQVVGLNMTVQYDGTYME